MGGTGVGAEAEAGSPEGGGARVGGTCDRDGRGVEGAERGDARIDEFRNLTIDKAEFDDHVYLDKAPGMTLLALPAAAVAECITARPPIPPASAPIRAARASRPAGTGRP